MHVLLDKAESWRKQAKWAMARDAYSTVLRHSKFTSYPAAYGAGRASGAEHDYEAAMEFFAIAAKVAPEKQEPLIEMANLSYRLRLFNEALGYISKAEKIGSLSDAAVLIKLRCYSEACDYESACLLCDEMLSDIEGMGLRFYQWKVRKARFLFFMGYIAQAKGIVHELKQINQKEVEMRLGPQVKDDGAIDVVLNSYRRPREVKFQRWWLSHQTIPIRKFWVWHNHGGDNYMQQAISGAQNAINDVNHKFYGRFAFGLLSDAKYLAYFDDDTIPGIFWLQNCLTHFQRRAAVYVAVGVRLLKYGKYTPHQRSGWVTGDQDVCVPADLGGHGWFFERDWLRHFWFEKPTTFQTGEDMHLSFSVQKHLSFPTFSPPHPKICVGLWGSVLGHELGQDLGSSSMKKAGSHFDERDYCVEDLNSRGWKLIDAE